MLVLGHQGFCLIKFLLPNTGLSLRSDPQFLSVSSSSLHESVSCSNLVQRSCFLLDPSGAELKALTASAQCHLSLLIAF